MIPMAAAPVAMPATAAVDRAELEPPSEVVFSARLGSGVDFASSEVVVSAAEVVLLPEDDVREVTNVRGVVVVAAAGRVVVVLVAAAAAAAGVLVVVVLGVSFVVVCTAGHKDAKASDEVIFSPRHFARKQTP
jgi:hypothetical protein